MMELAQADKVLGVRRGALPHHRLRLDVIERDPSPASGRVLAELHGDASPITLQDGQGDEAGDRVTVRVSADHSPSLAISSSVGSVRSASGFATVGSIGIPGTETRSASRTSYVVSFFAPLGRNDSVVIFPQHVAR